MTYQINKITRDLSSPPEIPKIEKIRGIKNIFKRTGSRSIMGGWKSSIKDKQKNVWQVTSFLEIEDWQMKRINRPVLSNNRRHALLPPCFYLSFILLFSLLLSSSFTSHFALIQLCICILNDSITWNPAVKITDVFHYFSPLGHHDPSLAPITSPLFSVPLSGPLSPPVLFCSSPTVALFSC